MELLSSTPTAPTTTISDGSSVEIAADTTTSPPPRVGSVHGFCDLAAELRLPIYDEFFSNLIQRPEHFDTYVLPSEWPDIDLQGYLSLLCTCKQVYEEAKEHFEKVYLPRLTLYFSNTPTLHDFRAKLIRSADAKGLGAVEEKFTTIKFCLYEVPETLATLPYEARAYPLLESSYAKVSNEVYDFIHSQPGYPGYRRSFHGIVPKRKCCRWSKSCTVATWEARVMTNLQVTEHMLLSKSSSIYVTVTGKLKDLLFCEPWHEGLVRAREGLQMLKRLPKTTGYDLAAAEKRTLFADSVKAKPQRAQTVTEELEPMAEEEDSD